MIFKDLKQAIDWVETQIKFKPKADLDRMHQAFLMLGLSLDTIQKIHIAGTNGKGSVASYISHILMEAGYKVGTYTSPYLLTFNERIRVGMNPIDDGTLFDYLNWIASYNETFTKHYGEPLSFFELITLVCFKYYHDIKVDYMVIEVGLGGLYDATNILNYDLSLITSIGFDHMKQLGNTLESIAFNKLGILKDKNHLITTVDPSLHGYFKMYLKEKDVTSQFLSENDVKMLSYQPVCFKYKDQRYELPLLGTFQVLNGLISIEAMFFLLPKISVQTIQKGLLKASWPGRLEKIDTNTYLDGAHNTHAMDALKESLKKTFVDQKIHILFSALSDKDIKGMLDLLKDVASSITLTSFPDPRFKAFEDLSYPFIEDALVAIKTIQTRLEEDAILVITGSLHFIGYVKGNYQV